MWTYYLSPRLGNFLDVVGCSRPPPHDLLLAGFDVQLLLVADSSSKSHRGIGGDAAVPPL